MNIKSIQLLKSSSLALIVIAIASITGGWLVLGDRVTSNQSQAPNANRHDAGKMPGMMQHGSEMMQHGGMMHHNMAMDLGPADANYDLRFIDAMRLHHRGAIAMAKEAQQKSQRREIKNLARNIIIAQNREENELLRKWREAWYPNAPEEPVVYGGQGKSIMPMSEQQQQSMSMLKELGSANAEFDLRFMNAMIAHHQGAIDMAKDALSKSNRAEIKQLANEIVTSQQKEIDQMRQWREAWYRK
jgi:uncharacterized protein (DUF305 family)